MTRPTISDADIEAVARRMCIELGMDPDESVQCGAKDDETVAERYADSGHRPRAIMSYMQSQPCWRLWRKEAEAALAADVAVRALRGAQP